MKVRKSGGLFAIAALLSSCGGDSGGGSTSTGGTGTGTGTGSGTATAACSLRARQDWVLARMNEWYLFPETLPASLDPSGYATLDAYVDALTATARAQRKDRYFTYVTSVAQENAYYNSGATAGFGVRLSYDASNRLYVAEAFESAPALNAGIDRGAQIVAIGNDANSLRNVSDILASQGSAGVTDALGPSTTGTTRVLRITDAAGTRNVTVAKADYNISPVSTRYGYKIIDDGGTKVGYVNLRTFISSADAQLRTAFAAFRDAGVTKAIVDLRYNGGGLLSTAEVMTDLLGGARSTADVQSYTTFRASKSSQNEVRNFQREANAISPIRIAFIGTGGTASASEYVMNAFIPYLHTDAALVGANTYGKPVGQIALDNPTCTDDRLRVIAFALQNASRQGDYYDGLATRMETTCAGTDDLAHAMGDPAEGSTKAALDFLAGRSCTRIGTTASADRGVNAFAQARTLLSPDAPDTAQRETPGLF